ncbi:MULTISPECIES: helix-turn-helix domain-containing protein [Leuconostoc]|uniref:XRE family transcriptional regulator n=1 Tax=Leuconostoc kimchii TaxID=136609 RepID=A0ABX5SIN5_9LACO|nr:MULTISPECIES: helix-turn-helix transcriptional regulator [Leuconostoc]AEJ31664.1 HTH-type transcriptional regulator [Leuconostoc sp. C2]QBR46893.1 XRE family transcriptional regulator [Leuconostoc kimchii]
MDTTINDIADALRNKRTQREYTIEKLAELADVSVGTISTLETKTRTNISVSTLLKLMKALDINGYDIFGSEKDDVKKLIADNQKLRQSLNDVIALAKGGLEE